MTNGNYTSAIFTFCAIVMMLSFVLFRGQHQMKHFYGRLDYFRNVDKNIPYVVLLHPKFDKSIRYNASQVCDRSISQNIALSSVSISYEVPTDSWLCLTVAYVSSTKHREFNSDIIQPDVALISHNSLVAPVLQSCETHHSMGIQYVCHYFVILSEPGVYNISIRGDHFLIPAVAQSVDAFHNLGFYMGRYREVRTQHLQQLVVRGDHHYHSGNNESFISNSGSSRHHHDALPYCTFKYEVEFHRGNGNPQWHRQPIGMSPVEESRLRALWYNDSYTWGNNLCRNRIFSGEEILDTMDKKNISKILLVGDSLTRFMWGDFEDQFSGCTQEWLLRHPIEFYSTDQTVGSFSSPVKTSWDNALSSAGGFGVYFNQTGQCYRQFGIHPPPKCCENNSCTHRTGRMVIHQFLPGFMGPSQAELIMPPIQRSVEEWERIFKAYFDEEWPEFPNIVVFNAGLWLINAYKEDSPIELEKIVTAWMNLCKQFNALFVWRSTFYHHRSTKTNRLITKCNSAVIQLLVEKYNHPFFMDSNYYMSMLRPDRTVDGFHYNYRMLRSSWHRCTDQDFKKLDPDCVRDMSWPMSVAKAASLNLINLLLND